MTLKVGNSYTAQMLVGTVDLTAVPIKVKVHAFGGWGVRVEFLAGDEHGFETGTQRIIGWNAFPRHKPSMSEAT